MLDIGNAQTQLNDLMDQLEETIGTLVLASNIPLIGSHVSTATASILAGLQEVRTKIDTALADVTNDADVLDLLAAAINDLDILGQADLLTATVNGAGDLDIKLEYEDSIDISPAAFDFGGSTGLLGSFDADASVALEAEAGFDINFTIDQTTGDISLDEDATAEEFSLSLLGEVDYDTTATLGFLTVNVADGDDTPEGTLDDLDLSIVLDLRSGVGNDPVVTVDGTVNIDADITVEDDLLSILPGVEGSLLIDLSYAAADLTGTDAADFGLDIQLKDVKLKIDGLVQLYNDIFGELNELFDTFPIGQIVDILISAIPVISKIAPSSVDLYPEREGAADGDGEISLADIVVLLSKITGGSPVLDFLLGVIKVAEAIDALETLGDALADGEFSIGDLTLASSALDDIADGMGVADGDNLVESGGSDLEALTAFINTIKGIASGGSAEGASSDAAPADAGPADAGPADAGPADAGPLDVDPDDSIVTFPWLTSTDALLESLASLMLNGFGAQPISLIELDIPELNFEVSQRLPITFGIFYGFIGGGLEATIDIDAGYDTSGFTNGGFAFDEGFYLSPDLPAIDTGMLDEDGEPIMKQPFGNLGLTLQAGGGVDVVLARIEVAGGLLGEINVFLGGTGEDDNKAYLSELGGCLINEIAGRVAVGLDLTFSIGFGIFSISKTIGLAEVTLAQFNIDPCEDHGGAAIPEVINAGLGFAIDSGVLTLNTGPLAADRGAENDEIKKADKNYDENGVETDGPAINEVFAVTRVPGAEPEEGEEAEDPLDPFDVLAIQAFGVFERFDAESDFVQIKGDGADGNDRLSVEAGIAIDASFSGGAGNDVLTGSDGDDNLSGDSDKDQLFGGIGNDILLGGSENDVLSGGAGADYIDGGEGAGDQVDYSASDQGVTLIATPLDPDTAFGYGGDAQGDVVLGVEYYIGSAFNDTFYGNVNQSNIFDAGDGDDMLVGGDEGDLFIGGKGADVMYGNQPGRLDGPSDAASYVFSEAAVVIDVAANFATGGEAQGDTFFGIEDFQLTIFGDRFVGDDQSNFVDAYDGDDFINAGAGADTVVAGLGDDTVIGGLDGDDLDGGGFINRLRDRDLLSYQNAGVAVNANLAAGIAYAAADNILNPATVRDTIATGKVLYTLFDGSPFITETPDTYDASSFEDLRGSDFNDVLTGDDRSNTIEGGEGNDDIFGGGGADQLIGGADADNLFGGDGTDTADYRTSDGFVHADLVNNGSFNDAGGDTYDDVENLIGSRFADELSGDDEDNVLDPFRNDGAGIEQLNGRGGTDTAVFNYADGYDDASKFISLDAGGGGVVRELTAATNTLLATMSSIEQLRAFTGEGNDAVLSATAGNDLVNTHGGADIISVGAGFDLVYSGAGDDFVLRGNFDTNQVTNIGGGADFAQSFYLNGGAGTDALAIDLSYLTEDVTLFRVDPADATTDLTFTTVNGGTVANFEALIGAFGGSGDDLLGQLGDINSFFAGNAGSDLVATGFGFDTADGGESSTLRFIGSTLQFVEDIDTLIVDYSSAETGIMVSDTDATAIDAANVGRVRLLDSSDDVAPTLAQTTYRNFERLFLTGTDRDDVIVGMNQEPGAQAGDVLIGGEGNDSLVGGAGNDVLIGASRGMGPTDEIEANLYEGGEGADRFVLADADGLLLSENGDLAGIADFNRGEGDVIVLAGSADDYVTLAQSLGDRQITYIFIRDDTMEGGFGRLIAQVVSLGGPNLNSSDVEYVGPSPRIDSLPDAFIADDEIGSLSQFRALMDTSVTVSPDLSLSLFRAGALDDMQMIEAISLATRANTGTALSQLDIGNISRMSMIVDAPVFAALEAESAASIETADITLDAQFMIDNVIADFAEEAFEISDVSYYSQTIYDGNGAAAGRFNDAFGLEGGFVISTGRVDEIFGENTVDGQYNLAPESSPEIALDFVDLGTTDGRTLYRAELPSLPGGIASLMLTDDNDLLGGASGQYSAFDLDALKISTAFVNGPLNAAGFNALSSLDVFDFSPTGTVFTAGAMRPGANQQPNFAGTINGFVNQANATLDVSDGTTTTPTLSTGIVSLGDGGSLGFELTSNVSSAADAPTYLYLVETGAKEDLTGAIRVSSQPIDTVGDLSTDLGAPGLEGDTTTITSTFTVDFAGGKPDFEENTFVDFFDIVMVTEELPERGGILDPDIFRVRINGYDAVTDGEGATVTMTTLARSPFGPYAEGLTLNLLETGPMVSDLRADAYTTIYRVSGPIIDGINTIEIEVSDQKDAFLDTALFIAPAGESIAVNGAPIARNDLLQVVEGADGSVDLIGGIGLDEDPDGDALSITSISLLNTDGTVRQVINAGLATFTDLDGDNGAVRVSTTGLLVFSTGNDFDALNTGEVGSVRFGYTLSDGTDDATGSVTALVIGEDDIITNTAPVITSATTFDLVENTTGPLSLAANDAEGDVLVWTISGGVDAGLFAIDITTGALSFIASPDFEAPGDTGADNVYDVSVTVADPDGLSDSADIAVTVTDEDESIPLTPIIGTDGRDVLIGTAADELIWGKGGSYDRLTGNGGADTFVFGPELANGIAERDRITDFEAGVDSILLATDDFSVRFTNRYAQIIAGDDNDRIYVYGSGLDLEGLGISQISTDDDLFS